MGLALSVLAIVVPSGTMSPLPSASPGAEATLRTIVTVKSSPYCNALAQHFNGAYVPLAGNDRSLDGVNVDLLDINDAFSHPDFGNRLYKARERMISANAQIKASLPTISGHIMALREAAATTKDAQTSSATLQAVAALQTAYLKQKQLSIDLTGLAASMQDIDTNLEDHPLSDSVANSEPKDMRDIKSYLRFDGARDVIAQAESKAVDIAYDVATKKCSAP